MKGAYRDGARAIAPIAVAAFAFALSFGVLARTAGMGWAAPLVMSATTFSGAAQFAVASILHDKGSAVAAILAAGMLSARYIPIGISIATSFTGSTLRRFLQSQCVVDETWAVALNRPGGFDVRVLVGAGGALYIAWNAGTAVGLVLGNVIGDANRLGLDAAFPALFLALLIPQLNSNRKLVAALLGGGIALVLIPFTPAGVPIVAASVACLVGWRSE